MTTASAPATRPASATNNTINSIGLLCAGLTLATVPVLGVTGVPAAVLVVAAYAVPILLLEVIMLRTPWRASAGLDFGQRNLEWPRFWTRLIGVYGSFGFVAFLYWLFPEYHGTFYNPYWECLSIILPVAAILSVPYIAFMDTVMKDPQDGYYWWGCVLTLKFDGVPWAKVWQHLLGWIVKGYFLPLMFIYLSGNLGGMAYRGGSSLFGIFGTADFMEFFRNATALLFTVDLLGAVAGYILSLRLFDTHMRSTEPTLLGWLSCVICYQPLQSVVMAYYFANISGESAWAEWLAGMPVLQVLWGSVILVLLFLYVAATVNFGCRFSNLTHRGVLTNGMYRWTKHPAYVTKNIFWWLAAVPFIHDWEFGIRAALLLICVNIVYYTRARTEENHLSHDPEYVAYALYMNTHSIFASLAKKLPFLRYKAPEGWTNWPKTYKGINK